MATFQYRTQLSLEPRPGVRYATTYYKMTPAQSQQLIAWLASIGSAIDQVCDENPDWAEWLNQPLKRFRKSRAGEYYTPLELLTDMLTQLTEGRDLPEAMVGRWNRLCGHTDWQMHMTDQTPDRVRFDQVFERGAV